jgi:hypothetical protein
MSVQNPASRLFEQNYLSSLSDTSSPVSEIIRADCEKNNILNQLSKIKITFPFDDDYKVISYKRGCKELLRWMSQEMLEKLSNQGLNHYQIREIHKRIVGNDGNLYGHSINIYNYAAQARLSFDEIIACLTHGLGEADRLIEGIKVDFPTNGKNPEDKQKEQDALIRIYRMIDYSDEVIAKLIPITNKLGVEGGRLKKIEALKFFERSDRFTEIYNKGDYKMATKIIKTGAIGENWKLAFRIAEIYMEYFEYVIPDIKSKPFYNIIQQQRDNFIKDNCFDNVKEIAYN